MMVFCAVIFMARSVVGLYCLFFFFGGLDCYFRGEPLQRLRGQRAVEHLFLSPASLDGHDISLPNLKAIKSNRILYWTLVQYGPESDRREHVSSEYFRLMTSFSPSPKFELLLQSLPERRPRGKSHSDWREPRPRAGRCQRDYRLTARQLRDSRDFEAGVRSNETLNNS
jgi:hypothetical protein